MPGPPAPCPASKPTRDPAGRVSAVEKLIEVAPAVLVLVMPLVTLRLRSSGEIQAVLMAAVMPPCCKGASFNVGSCNLWAILQDRR